MNAAWLKDFWNPLAKSLFHSLDTSCCTEERQRDFTVCLCLNQKKPSPNSQADLDIHQILSQYQLDISSPMALAMCLTLLMFLTSVLTPIGSPGRCTDTLASTLSCPSVRGEKEGSNENHYNSTIHSSQNPCLTNSAYIWIWMIYLHEILYSESTVE